MVIAEPTVARSWNRAIRPGFETMLRMLNKDAEPFSSTPKLSKRDKGSAGKVQLHQLVSDLHCYFFTFFRLLPGTHQEVSAGFRLNVQKDLWHAL